MVTSQDGSGVRVERVEWAAWFTTGVLALFTVVLAVYFLSLPGRVTGYVVAAVISSLGFVLCRTNFRRRHVLLIEPDRVGYGFVGGPMWWVERDRIGAVRVHRNLLLQVRFMDTDGRLLAAHVLSHFDPGEVRRALESAGIRMD